MNLGPVKQDVRRELGHGHRLEHELSELERLGRRLESGGLGERQRALESRELWSRARDVEDGLLGHGLGDAADLVVERASRHHPDSHDLGHRVEGEFDFAGGRR